MYLHRAHNRWNCKKRKKFVKSLHLNASNWDQDEEQSNRSNYWGFPLCGVERKSGGRLAEENLDCVHLPTSVV